MSLEWISVLSDNPVEKSSNTTTLDQADSRIGMAEQSRHDVVNQTRSGGDPSPSDVPASKPDKESAGGDVGGSKEDIVITRIKRQTADQLLDEKTSACVLPAGTAEVRKASGSSETVSLL
jgi:hypothetical protein